APGPAEMALTIPGSCSNLAIDCGIQGWQSGPENASLAMRKRKVQFKEWTIAALVAFVSVACAGQQATESRGVLAPVANLHSAPDENSDVVSQAIYGSSAEQLEERGGWIRIRTADRYTGWILSSATLRQDPSHPPYATSGTVAQVRSLSANLYRETDVTVHQPVITVPFETRLAVTATGAGEDADWLQVRLVDGSTAWIQQGDVTLQAKTLTIPESIDLAKRFLGITYTWGGTSSFGFDCSGFTQMLVRSRGIIMPRDADQQAAWSGMISIDRKHLRPGDLLYFGGSAASITHTGMFIGHGQFIHDSVHEHPGVQISRVQDEPWTHLLVACRR